MYRFILAAMLLFPSVTFSQDSPQKPIIREDTLATKQALENAQRFLDSFNNAARYRDVNAGLENLMRYQEEQRKKQKKKAFIYIALGVFFLAVLVVGMRRRAKK